MKRLTKSIAALISTAFLFVQNVQAIEISQQYINNNRSHQSLKAIGVVIHDTDDAGGTAQNNRDYFNNNYVSASAHYFVDWNNIIQTIPEDEVAWHAGPTANHKYLSIEICVPASHNVAEFNKAYKNAVDLAADMCERYGWTESDVYSHNWCSLNYGETDHTDPVAYFAEYGKSMDTFRNDVANILKIQNAVSESDVKKAANYLGNNAKRMQYILNCFGYNLQIDGTCGKHTTQCIGSLQRRLGINRDFLFGPKSIEKAISKLDTAYKGCSYTDEVKLIQYVLGVQPINGNFGDQTYVAVMNFQKNNGINADGKVGAKTLTKMLIAENINTTNNTNTNNSKPNTQINNSGSANTSNNSSTSNNTNNSSNSNNASNLTTLAEQNADKASKYLGQNVKKVQYILNCFGYNLTPDGICGKRTTQYIGDLQQRLGIKPDYLFGPTSIKKAASKMNIAEKGCSYTAETKLIQYMLGVQPINGNFGNQTYAAVINYQKTHGIYADGRVGAKTFSKMLV